MQLSCKYCDSKHPDHTSSQHHESSTQPLHERVSKVTISHSCDEDIARNILSWTSKTLSTIVAK